MRENPLGLYSQRQGEAQVSEDSRVDVDITGKSGYFPTGCDRRATAGWCCPIRCHSHRTCGDMDRGQLRGTGEVSLWAEEEINPRTRAEVNSMTDRGGFKGKGQFGGKGRGQLKGTEEVNPRMTEVTLGARAEISSKPEEEVNSRNRAEVNSRT